MKKREEKVTVINTFYRCDIYKSKTIQRRLAIGGMKVNLRTVLRRASALKASRNTFSKKDEKRGRRTVIKASERRRILKMNDD